MKICKLRALVGLDISAPIMFPTFSFKIYTYLFIIIMTSRKKVPVSSFGHVYCVTSEIQDGGRHHIKFSSHVNLEHSVMLMVLELYIKFGSNICYSH